MIQTSKAILSYHQYKILKFLYKHDGITLENLLDHFGVERENYLSFLEKLTDLVDVNKKREFFLSEVHLSELGLISYEQMHSNIFDRRVTRYISIIALVFSLISIIMNLLRWFIL